MLKTRKRPKPSKPKQLTIHDLLVATRTGVVTGFVALVRLISPDNIGAVLGHEGRMAGWIGAIMALIHLIGLYLKDNRCEHDQPPKALSK